MMSYYRESWWESFWDGPIGFLLGFGASVGALLAAIAAGAMAISIVTGPPSCAAYAKQMAIHTEWNFWTGCMIDVKGQLLPWSEVIPVEKDGHVVFTTKPRIGIEALDKQQN